MATPAEAAELRTLVQRVLADRPDDWDEATAVALADPEAALESLRALAATATVATTATDTDDRRTCRQCVNLSQGGRCLAAWRGELPSVASRNYSPVPDVPRRCEGFTPGPDDVDQRPGAERWPGLMQKGST